MLDYKSSILLPYDGTELSLKALEKSSFPDNIMCVDDRIVYLVGIQKFVTRTQDLDNVKEQLVNIIMESAISLQHPCLRKEQTNSKKMTFMYHD